MSDLLNKMMEANKLTNEQAKKEREDRLEARRHELAGAMTRMMVNEALGRVQQSKQENEALAAAKARAEKG